MIRPVKVAVLSCNHGHARKYYGLSLPYYELVGVSIAPGYKNRVGLEDLPHIPQYDSDDELYATHPDIEAVVVASDNASHFRQVKWAAERGLHEDIPLIVVGTRTASITRRVVASIRFTLGV